MPNKLSVCALTLLTNVDDQTTSPHASVFRTSQRQSTPSDPPLSTLNPSGSISGRPRSDSSALVEEEEEGEGDEARGRTQTVKTDP